MHPLLQELRLQELLRCHMWNNFVRLFKALLKLDFSEIKLYNFQLEPYKILDHFAKNN